MVQSSRKINTVFIFRNMLFKINYTRKKSYEPNRCTANTCAGYHLNCYQMTCCGTGEDRKDNLQIIIIMLRNYN